MGRGAASGPALAPAPAPRRPGVILTEDFTRWLQGLDPEQAAKVGGALNRIAAAGPTLGRPRVDRIHGSRLHKLKEARIDRGMRALFAFDSRGDAVMLVGGDKSGQWNRWYPRMIERAERLYGDHERGIGGGGEGRWRDPPDAGLTLPRGR